METSLIWATYITQKCCLSTMPILLFGQSGEAFGLGLSDIQLATPGYRVSIVTQEVISLPEGIGACE
jgi:hypothetical protein